MIYRILAHSGEKPEMSKKRTFNQGVLGSSPSALTNNQPSKTSNPSRRFRLGVWGRTALDRLTPRPSPRRRSTQPADLPKSGSRMRQRAQKPSSR